MTDELLKGKRTEEDRVIEETLRPRRLCEFIGQKALKRRLSILIEAGKKRGEAIDHILFYSPPGLGKTTLSHIVAQELGVNIKLTTGPVIERPADLAGLLTSLKGREVLFIDEIHRLPRIVEEYLYSAMEDFRIDIVIDKGPSARSVRLNLAPFTLIGSTTRAGLITGALRSRFGFIEHIDYYPAEDLYKIIFRSARILGIDIDEGGALEIAKRARGTPRVANRLLKRVRDYAEVEGDGKIDRQTAVDALALFGVDDMGLDQFDKMLLRTIIEKFGGGPVGIGSLAVALSENKGTIEELSEPYLLQMGLLKRTLRGRVATPIAYQHLGYDLTSRQELF